MGARLPGAQGLDIAQLLLLLGLPCCGGRGQHFLLLYLIGFLPASQGLTHSLLAYV